MTRLWFRVKQGYHATPRFADVSELAELLWLRALDYCSSNLTDGWISKRAAATLLNVSGWAFEGEPVTLERLWDELVLAGLVEDDGGSWHLHDYLDYQASRDDVARKQAARAAAGKRGAEKRWHPDEQPAEAAPMANAMANAMPFATESDGKPHGKPMPDKDKDQDQERGPAPAAPATARQRAARSRGTRLPASFTLTPEMAEYARTKGPALDAAVEFERFRNYWLAKPGQQGVKVDWVATWRNWVLSGQERAVARGWMPPKVSPAQVEADRAREAAVAARRRWCEARGTTLEEWMQRKDDDEWRYAVEARGEALNANGGGHRG